MKMANELAKTTENTGIAMPAVPGGALSVFANADSFVLAQRMAQALASSTIVPKAYQGNVGNCMIAIEMASRINTSPMMVMQNLYIVNGNPAWSSQWIIAMINKSGRYKTELQFEFGHAPEDDGLSCRAWAEDRSGHRVEGPKITMKMAKDEGWLGKTGSKWKTMPEVMIRYRATSFFGRVNCPDMVMGIYSQEEIIEMGDSIGSEYPAAVLTDPKTGEVIPVKAPTEDPVITQKQRQTLLETARNHLGQDADAIFDRLLSDKGLKSTTNMTSSVYNEILAEVMRIAEETNHGSEPHGDKPEETAPDAD